MTQVATQSLSQMDVLESDTQMERVSGTQRLNDYLYSPPEVRLLVVLA